MTQQVLRRTRFRLTLASAAVFTAVAVVAGSGMWLLTSKSEYAAVDSSLQAQADALVSGLDVQNGVVTFQGSDSLPAQTTSGIAVSAVLVSPSGQVLNKSGTSLPTTSYASLVGPTVATGRLVTTVSVNGVSERLETQPVDIGTGQRQVLVVARPIAEVQGTLNRLAWSLAAGIALLVIVGAGLSYWLAGRALARLEASFAALRRFTADAAHELRAPLAILRAESEVALARSRNPTDDQAALQTMLDEVLRLSNMTDQLLLLARADGGVLATREDPVDLCSLISEATGRWNKIAGLRDVSVTPDCTKPVVVTGDPDLLRRVVDNLLDNALRFTPAGGCIRLTATATGRPTLAVEDKGPGVAPQMRNAMFDRFTKEDEVRRRDSGGAGLGLSLCRAIMNAHGGTITYEDAQPGARFVLHFPAREERVK